MNDVVKQVRLNRIEGYCDLEMWEDAEMELSGLEQAGVADLTTRGLGLRTMMGLGRWAQAVDRARQLSALQPENGSWFIHGAFCLHELGQTAEARDFLLSGPPSLKQEALFFYNLACYECVLGRLEEARLLLAKAFEKEPGLRQTAEADEDLKALG